MHLVRRLPALFTLVLLAGSACGRGRAPEVAAELTKVLAADRSGGERSKAAWADVRTFYGKRTGEPVWVSDKAPVRVAAEALKAVARASDHGLDPEKYGVAYLTTQAAQLKEAPRPGPSAADLAKFDADLTAALLALGRDVAMGQSGPPPAGVGPERHRAPVDIEAHLTSIIDAGDLGKWPDDVRPAHPQYSALEKALATAPPDRRAVIALNMERWRWMPDDLGARHIMVNIPQFHLFVREGEAAPLAMRVIVGKAGDETPLFSADLAQVVFSPYWNIPDSIAEGETVPSIVRNPAYLAKNNIEVLRRSGEKAERIDPSSIDWKDPSATKELSLRQRPGPGNALGHVKFLMPNRFNVYLHDTPADKLFEKEGRAFSHGCIRLDEPEALAKYVLADFPEWTEAKIKEAMHSGDEQTVKLKRPIPVHILYFTAWVGADGTVTYFDDVYGRDKN